MASGKLKLYSATICPFCQRAELIIDLVGAREHVEVVQIDLSVPRPDWFLAKTGGTTSVPVLELEDGRIIKESLVIVRYFEDRFGVRPSSKDPYVRALHNAIVSLEGNFTPAGYKFLLNRDQAQTNALGDAFREQCSKLEAFLKQHSPSGKFLTGEFGFAEVSFAPFLYRFSALFEHYLNWSFSQHGFERLQRWTDACLAHPGVLVPSKEDVIKMYYDYAYGGGSGKILEGRKRSTFVKNPPPSARPLPPRDKWSPMLSDEQLGLVDGKETPSL